MTLTHRGNEASNQERVGFEVVAPLLPTSEDASPEERSACASVFFIVYERGNLIADVEGRLRFSSTSSLYLTCQPALNIANMSATVSQSGRIQSVNAIGRNMNTSESLIPPNDILSLYANLNQHISWTSLENFENVSFINGKSGQTNTIHRDSFAYNWFPYLIMELLGSRDTVNTSLPAPSADTIIPAASILYKQLATTLLALHQDEFFPILASENSTITAIQMRPGTRVFMSNSTYWLCLMILILDVLVAAAYYYHRPQQLLPYMPTNIASILSLFQGSSLAESANENHGKWDKDWHFGFGKFVGTDRKLRVGIERQPFVYPLPKVLKRSDVDPLMDWDVMDGSKLRKRAGGTNASAQAQGAFVTTQVMADEDNISSKSSDGEGGRNYGVEGGGSKFHRHGSIQSSKGVSLDDNNRHICDDGDLSDVSNLYSSSVRYLGQEQAEQSNLLDSLPFLPSSDNNGNSSLIPKQEATLELEQEGIDRLSSLGNTISIGDERDSQVSSF